MIRVYHNPATEKVRFTFKGDMRVAPAGDFIEVPDGTDVSVPQSLRVRNGLLIEADVVPIRIQAVQYVNNTIEDVRSDFITNINGQQMIYNAKEQEAIAFMALSSEPTDLTDFPFLSGEIGSTGETASQVAQVYLNMAARWRQVGAYLEKLRVGLNVRIENAATKAEIEIIIDDLETSVAQFYAALTP